MTNHFFLLTSSTGCLRPPSEDEQPINTSPPRGDTAPNFGPSFGGPARPTALRIPHADKRREAPPGDACGIVVAPMALVASLRPRIPAYQGAQVAAAWVGTSRPASWACRGATAAGNAMAKHWARVARRRDCAAFGYVVNRATSDRVQPLRFFILVGSREVPPLAVQAMAGRAKALTGVWGCNPLPWKQP